MPKEPPEFLYKYRSLASKTERKRVHEIIGKRAWPWWWRKSEIYYPKPEQINDPFDCRMPDINSFSPWSARYWLAAQDAKTHEEHAQVCHKYREPRLRSPAEVAELNEALTAKEESEFKEFLSKEIKSQLKRTGVLSLCAVCNDVPMWSYYADGHKGICLKFCLDKWSCVKANILPVCYPKGRPLLDFDYESLKNGQVVKALVLTKDPSWSHEREWRSLAPTSGKRCFPEAALVGIILGCQISPENEKWLRSILPAGGRIKLYRAEKRPKEFGLDIRKL
jgi:hypothetical protein